MIELRKLSTHIEEKNILNEVSLSFEKGRNYCVVGENGSGKSSMALTIMGHPSHEIESGKIFLDGEDITEWEPHERAQAGIFLAFQNIPSIKGVKLFEFLRTAYNARFGTEEKFVSFKKIIVPLMEQLGIEKDFLRRDLNVGFSGGEKRKVEVLQIKLLKPTYIFLDEIDSGLDVDAFRNVANLLKELDSDQNSFIIITHYFTILDYLHVDHVYLLEKGQVKQSGDMNLVEKIKTDGFGNQPS